MDGAIPPPPMDCGRRLIPSLVDSIASSDPYRTFVSLPKSSNLEDGCVDVTYSAFARAVNRCSWWIEGQLGKSGNPKTLFYMGPLDIRYPIVMIAASKTGHVPFFSSHRNSLEAHLSLLNATKCDTILFPKMGTPVVTEKILGAKQMQILTMPEVDFFLSDETEVEIYPWNGTFDEMRFKTFVILHTSGSTGIPKPVYVAHGTFAGNDAHQLVPTLGGKPGIVHYLSGKRVFVAFPVFHAASIGFVVLYGVFAGLICVLPPPGPLNLDIVDKMHSFGRVEGSLLPPSIIIDIYNNPDYLANMLKKLKFVAYVGGSLPAEVGDPLSTGLKLITMIGATENIFYPVDMNYDDADWGYLPVSPLFGHEFRPARDGLYELIIVRNQNSNLLQGVFSTFPALDEYATSDLFEPHPTKPGSWVFRARGDDIICFSNAEKLNPVTMEGIITAHPAVNSAVIGGQGEFQASLLIEPKTNPTTETARRQLLDDIWPSIMQANRDCPAHGRIMKDFVMFTKPGKPLSRAGKDTVQRYSALKLYAEEFKELYANAKINEKSYPKNELKSTPNANSASSTIDLTSIDLDAHIERTLDRILPKALSQHLGPAFGQLVAKLFSFETPYNLETEEPKNIRRLSVSEPRETQAKDIGLNGKPENTLHQNGDRTEDLNSALHRIVSNHTYVQDLSDTTDLFAAGFDSLQMPALINEVNAFLIKYRPGSRFISEKMIYNHSTIAELTAELERVPGEL